jgi:vesicle coat complex subunit
VYQVYAQLRDRASLEQLSLLLQHESPNVRYYALLGLAEKDPKNKTTYYQQLAGKYDSLNTLNGCVGSSGQLWEFTRYRIFESEE